MTNVRKRHLVWKDNDLFLKDEKLMSVIQDKQYPSQFRLEWPDGVLSKDFYNFTRAKEHAMRIVLKTLGETVEDET